MRPSRATYCRGCGDFLPLDAAYCPACGTAVSQRGTVRTPDVLFQRRIEHYLA